jgi:hypothetical protein
MAMAAHGTMSGDRFWRTMRWVVWGGAAALLSLPLIAMQFTSEVNWTVSDFVVMGIMLTLVGVAFELSVRAARSNAYVVGAGIAVAAAFLMTWANLAVGIIGNEDNPMNLIFFGVLAIGLTGALFSRLQPLRMAYAMEATALAQAIACVFAWVFDGTHVFVITGVFLAMWLASAQLFRAAARQQTAIA